MALLAGVVNAEGNHSFKVTSVIPMQNAEVYPEGTVRIEFESGFDGKTDWALFTPGNRDKNTVVYMHGSFSHADQIYTRADVRAFWLTRIQKGEHPLLSVNLRDTTYMAPGTTQDLTHLLAYCARELGCSNYVLLGGSGGASSAMAYVVVAPGNVKAAIAMGTCDLIARLDFARKSSHPVLQKLAKVVFESYGGDLEEKPELYDARSILKHGKNVTIPLIVTIGEKDPLIPVEESRKIAAAMTHNPDYTYIEVPGGDHDSAVWVDIDLQTLEVIDATSVHP